MKAPERLPKSRKHRALIAWLNQLRDFAVENSLTQGFGTRLLKRPSGTSIEARPGEETTEGGDEPYWLP